MNWQEYIVTFHSARLDGVLVEGGKFTRCIRATSRSNAAYRVVRKFILPEDAEIVSIDKCN